MGEGAESLSDTWPASILHFQQRRGHLPDWGPVPNLGTLRASPRTQGSASFPGRTLHPSGIVSPDLVHHFQNLTPMLRSSRKPQSSGLLPGKSHRMQPTGLLPPWDFPGKSTGVGCHRLLPIVVLPTHIPTSSVGEFLFLIAIPTRNYLRLKQTFFLFLN